MAIGTDEASATDLHAGHRPRLFRELQEESARLVVAVVHEARVEAHHQQMIGAVSRTAAQLLLKAAIHEHRQHQQHHRDRDLAADQQAPAPTSPPPDHRLAALHDHRQVRARRLNRRSEAEQHRAEHGDDQAEHQRAAIELEGECDRQIGRELNLLKQLDGAIADGKTEHAAGERDQQALGHQLGDQPAAPRADGHAHRHLLGARRSPARQQARDVGARHEQHRERQRRQHRDQRRVGWRLRDSRLQLRANDQAPVAVRVRIRALQILRDHRSSACARRQAHA